MVKPPSGTLSSPGITPPALIARRCGRRPRGRIPLSTGQCGEQPAADRTPLGHGSDAPGPRVAGRVPRAAGRVARATARAGGPGAGSGAVIAGYTAAALLSCTWDSGGGPSHALRVPAGSKAGRLRQA